MYMSKKVDSFQNTLDQLCYRLKNAVNCQLPCIVQTVRNNCVDVLVISNDETENIIFPNVPIRHVETQNAYVFLGISPKDRGVIRYFDKSVESYRADGSVEFNTDTRQHSYSDGLFEIGFYPMNESYVYPADKTIEIGNKNGSFKLSVEPSGGCVLQASHLLVRSPVVELGEGGQPLARVGDSVEVTVSSGSSAGTWSGTITSGGVNKSA